MSLMVSPRELVLVVKPELGVRATPSGLNPMKSTAIQVIGALLNSQAAMLRPLFDLSKELLERRGVERYGYWGAGELHPSSFYKVVASDNKLESLAELLRNSEQVKPLVDAVYLKPPVELAMIDAQLSVQPGSTLTAPTADFSAYQSYLGAAPRGINARDAWPLKGGRGQGVNIIDVEGAWQFSHEDLQNNSGGMLGVVSSPLLSTRNHGTAVLGILGGDHNGLGVLGICPEANTRAISLYVDPQVPHLGLGTAGAIWMAANELESGSILILEAHSPGPLAKFIPSYSQYGYIPVEWWPDVKLAVEHARERGVLVVAAAGNGGISLDDDIYDVMPKPPHGPFPPQWRNPFRRGSADTGSILVGAGAPPPGTNNQDWGPDRSRLYYSNYGRSVDAQGWGYEVTSCGFGDLQQGEDENLWYTKTFNGTSSATPMVAGALACAQGAQKAAGANGLTFRQVRDLLYTTGSPQVGAPSRPITQRIGNRPDIVAMISNLPSS